MTEFQENIYNLIPENLLEKDSLKPLLDIFFHALENISSINESYPDFFTIDAKVLTEDLTQIFLQNIYEVLNEAKNDIISLDINNIDPKNKTNYCYSEIPENDIFKEFQDNSSTGLEVLIVGEKITVKEYFNGINTEIDKVFIVEDTTNITVSTTIDDAILHGSIKSMDLCCSTVPCVLPDASVVSCTLGVDINNFIRNYAGTDLAADLLAQISPPGNVVNCFSRVPDEVPKESPYTIGSPWLYTDFYIDYKYIDENLNLRNIIDISTALTDEHIWSAKNFKQNKGHPVSYYYIYNIAKSIPLDVGTDVYGVDYIKLVESKDENNNLVPFQYTVKSLMHEYIYKNIIKPIAHPVGFDVTYKRELNFSFTENFCKRENLKYDVFFIYCTQNDTYFDLRDGDGLFGSTGQGKDFRYSTEIVDYYKFDEYNKSYISILLDNGFRYVKDFNSSIKLLSPSGLVVKVFDDSCGIISLKSEIYNTETNECLKIIDNTREYSNTVDNTGIISTKVYRIEFDTTDGSFLTASDTKIYLVNDEGPNIISTMQYHVIDSRIDLYNYDDTLKYPFSDDYTLTFSAMKKYYDIICKEEMNTNIDLSIRNAESIKHFLIVQESMSDYNNPVYTVPKSYELDITTPGLDKLQNQIDIITFGSPDYSTAGSTYSIKINTAVISYTSNDTELFQNVIIGLKDSYLSTNLSDDDIMFRENINQAKITVFSKYGSAYSYSISIDGSDNSGITNITNIQEARDGTNLNEYIKTYIATNGTDDDIAERILDHLSPPDPVNITNDVQEGLDVNNNNIIDFYEYGFNNAIEYQDWGWTIGADCNNTLPSNYNVTNLNDFIANYTGSGTNFITSLFTFYHDSRNELSRVSPRVGCIDNEGDFMNIYDNFKYL